jgi:hypothetical protein
MANLRSVDNAAGTVYLHTGFTTSTTNYAGPSGANGITHDGTNIYLCTWGSKNIYKMVGETSTIDSTVSVSGYRPRGMTIDHNLDVVICDNTNGDLLRRFVGFSNTLSKMITVGTAFPYGVTYGAGAYFYSDPATDTVYKLVGDMTSTVDESYDLSGIANMDQMGITVLEGNLYCCDSTGDDIYKFVGLSNIEDTSIVSPGILVADITFDDYNGRITGGGGGDGDNAIFSAFNF